MPLKVDVLVPNNSLYAVLHHFTYKLFEALQRAGCTCRLLEGDQRYICSLESPPDFTIGFNGALKIEGGSLYCDYVRVPHVACLVDPPFRFIELTASPYIILTCDDIYFCEDFKKSTFPNTFFMPHAVEKELAPLDEAEKIYDVTMLATFVDCEQRRKQWKDKFPAHICRSMEEAVALTLSDERTSFVTALKQFLGPSLEISLDQNPIDRNLLQAVFSEVELYIKGRDKLDLLYALKDCEVHVFGASIDKKTWQDMRLNYPHIIVHPEINFKAALEVMKRTKVLLNSNIKNKGGGHERIFSGMACGAAVVTNDNAYLREQFVDGAELVLYRRSAFAELNGQVQQLLTDEPRRCEMVRQARLKVMARHTWDQRVAQLLADIKPILAQKTS